MTRDRIAERAAELLALAGSHPRVQALTDTDLRVERRNEKDMQDWAVVGQTLTPKDDREVQANARK